MRAFLTLIGALWVLLAGAAPPDILLAQTYRAGIDVRDYLVSEKFDGVRAIWDGHSLRFRSGNVVPAPAWFIAGLPPEPLDGELWLGHGKFERLSAIVRTQTPDDVHWREVSYLIFEAPGHPGHFAERAAHIATLVARQNTPWLRAVPQHRIADERELQTLMHRLLRQGAEGLMLHRADALYITGRSDALLKLKPAPDAEAVVVGHIPGKGKYARMTGALEMQMPDGTRFRLGSGLTDALRRAPPPIGALVTYRYQELTAKGLPRFPRYLRVREEF